MSDTEYISKDAFITQQRKQYCVNCERRKGTRNGKRIFVYEIGEAPCRSCDIGDMIDAVWDFIAADVAPVVHGHWKANRKLCMPECSVCKARPFRGYIPSMYEAEEIYKYCPHCGAKMDEEESGNA